MKLRTMSAANSLKNGIYPSKKPSANRFNYANEAASHLFRKFPYDWRDAAGDI